VAKLAEEWKQKANLSDPVVNRNTYLRRIEGLIYGEDPKGGYLENSVFYHPELRFQFNVPNGWSYQNTPQQVQMASQDGKAMLVMTLGRGNSPQEAASAFVQQYQLQTVDSRSTTVNGLSALMVVADQPAQQGGGGVRTINYFIQYGNAIYHMLGATMQQDFNAYNNTLQQSMQSFRQLTDQAKISKKPERIRLRTVNSATTLGAALRSYGMPERRMEELAVLNGMRLTDTVPSGMMIKIVAE
jgi:predicted Zn-dependent protease